MRSEKMIAALNEALDRVEDARQLVGRAIPIPAVEWAEKNGLSVTRSEFVPPGRLFIIGALPVDWDFGPGSGVSGCEGP